MAVEVMALLANNVSATRGCEDSVKASRLHRPPPLEHAAVTAIAGCHSIDRHVSDIAGGLERR